MEAWCITLKDNPYSEECANRCIDSANIRVRKFSAVTGERAKGLFHEIGLRWTWGQGYKSMQHKPYGGDHWRRVACFLSHFLLWGRCVRHGPMLILEHDAVFIREFVPFEFEYACMINDPAGATPKGHWWSEVMKGRGPGVWPKTKVFDDTRPDGLAGNSAYVINPLAAQRLIDLTYEIGAWPNDAIMCRQFMPLQEHYPFITEVRATQSTI